ncbi:MAG: hypothetical protein R3D34_15925 [Nitratireductor sp.]
MQNPSFILRVEGVNMGETVFNTADLSTLRGASLALEMAVEMLKDGNRLDAMAKAVSAGAKITPIYAGGSQAVMRVDAINEAGIETLAGQLRAILASGEWSPAEQPVYAGTARSDNPPTQHLCFCVDWAELPPLGNGADAAGAVRQATDLAMVKTRYRQMRAPSLPPVSTLTGQFTNVAEKRGHLCPVDPMRPVSMDDNHLIWTAKGQFPKAIVVDKSNSGKSERIRVCDRVGDLRPYGRSARSRLYTKQIGDAVSGVGDLRFAESFADLTQEPPAANISVSASSKMAVFYFDGTGFGAMRAQNELGKFSDFVTDLFSHYMVASAVRHLLRGANLHGDAARRYCLWRPDHSAGEDENAQFLRFETLMLGGEDWCFVAPGWLASELLEVLFAAHARCVDAWKDKDLKGVENCGLRAGVLICPTKTPIRRARSLAYDLCESARNGLGDGQRSSIDIHVIESIDVPEHALEAQRQRVHGNHVSGADFCFSGEGWAEIANDYRSLSSMPRSQLYKMISATRDMSDDKAWTTIQNITKRSSDTGEVLGERDVLPGTGSVAFRLRRLAELWDYVVDQPGAASVGGG